MDIFKISILNGQNISRIKIYCNINKYTDWVSGSREREWGVEIMKYSCLTMLMIAYEKAETCLV